MRRAKDIMTREVATVRLDTSVQELARLLVERHINGVPVLDEAGKLVGIVTEGDLIDQNKKLHIPTVLSLLDSVIFLESPKHLERELKKMAGTTVGDICTRDVITIDEDATLEEVATHMADKRINTIPVLRGGELVGVIGRSDVVRSILTPEDELLGPGGAVP
jgi:CBS domain-containing protein